MVAYDLRMKLGGPLPVILTSTPDGAAAQELVASLRSRHHGALAVDPSRVISSGTMISPQSFLFEQHALVVSEPDGRRHELPYAEVGALIRAMHATESAAAVGERKRKLSASRALLTGGMMITKSVSSKRQSSSEESAQVLYIFRRSFTAPLLLEEHHLHYQSLGERMGRTRGENFGVTVDLLRSLAPGAFYDDRLVSGRARSSFAGLAGTATQAVVVTSNTNPTDLAAHLLAMAHLEGQL